MLPIPIAFLQTGIEFFAYFTFFRILSVIALFFVAWLLIRYSSKLLGALSQRSLKARFLLKLIEPVVRITLWFIAIFLAFELLAPTRETFLAGVGSAAIAIGLGAQDLIKNLVGGLVILGDRPYQSGDRVKIGDAYGEIDHIGLRSTKLTTPDDTRVTIPNADILIQQVFNANSGVPDCLVVTDLVLSHGVDAAEARRIGHEAAYSSPFTYLSKPVVVLVQDIFDQQPYLRLRIKAYAFDHRFEPGMQSDITIRARAEFRRRGMLKEQPRFLRAGQGGAWGAPAETGRPDA